MKILIDELGLKTRTYNALRRDGFETIHQVVEIINRTPAERIPDIKNLGEQGLEDLAERLLAHHDWLNDANLARIAQFRHVGKRGRKD